MLPPRVRDFLAHSLLIPELIPAGRDPMPTAQ
jgi:hypothetical protein